MAMIKAFVGHSFTEDDDQVVTSFLKVLDQIKGALPNFDWTHARQAEPEELAKKVLRLIADCNTFIAICTRKEIVTRPSALTPRVFRSDSSVIRNDEIEWKTSDWIIQEIGLAVGRSMSLVILLEEGCRRPGGLQGDVEFIPFQRTNPERAFGRILEMLQALNPSSGTKAEVAFVEADTENPAEASQENSFDGDDDVPKPDWTKEDYERLVFWKIYKKDPEGFKAINEAYLQSTFAASAESKAVWDAKCEEWKLLFGDDGSLHSLQQLCESFPDNPRIKRAYASGLSLYYQYEDSANYYEAAASLESDPAERLSSLTNAVIQREQAGQPEIALKLLSEAKAMVADQKTLEYQLAVAINRYAECIKDNHLRIQAMERIVSLRPDDEDTRFNLAYTHSEAENNDMALYHYLAIPFSHRKSHVWNNLGVAYQDFSAPARAVDAFERAAKEGNTLAMSNLAYRYMQAGFLTEAQAKVDEALKESDPHKNVSQALAEISAVPDRENKAVDDLIKDTAPKIDAFKKMGTAICKPDIVSLAPIWTGPDCDVVVKLTGRRFEARGRYESKTNALSGLLGSTKPVEYEIVLEGTVFGHRVFGDVLRKPVGATGTSLLGDLDARKPFSIVFDDALEIAEVVESINARHPRKYELRIQQPSPSLAIAESN